jgi:glutamate-5-semialdehyde dehydrogenase
MSTHPLPLADYCLQVARQARVASRDVAQLTGQTKVAWLLASADAIRRGKDTIIEANRRDVAAAPDYGLSDAAIDRLRLTPGRLEGIASSLEQIASLPDPIGRVISSTNRPNGLRIDKVRSPLGVVLFVYESRPNVTADAAAICTMAGNAVILRGGKEAIHSSRALVEQLQRAGHEHGLPPHSVQLVDVIDREAVGHFLAMGDLIDVAIPRGGESLIRRVVAEATMPVIKHFDGNCHVYVDESANLDMAESIVVNSKCQRMGVCNAAESLLVHVAVAGEFLPRVSRALESYEIAIRGCPRTCSLVSRATRATDEDHRAEFLGPTISVKIVDSVDEAIEHINHYGSHHTDAIVTESLAASRQFAGEVDSSAVMINASTRFNDGGEFGFGAEIGISTDKFHARGPCGIEELTTYKYVVHGEGQIRQ